MTPDATLKAMQALAYASGTSATRRNEARRERARALAIPDLYYWHPEGDAYDTTTATWANAEAGDTIGRPKAHQTPTTATTATDEEG